MVVAPARLLCLGTERPQGSAYEAALLYAGDRIVKAGIRSLDRCKEAVATSLVFHFSNFNVLIVSEIPQAILKAMVMLMNIQLIEIDLP